MPIIKFMGSIMSKNKVADADFPKMREELREYAEEAYSIVEHAANVIGPRVPGTEGEDKFHDYMCEKIEQIGLKPKREPFIFAPRGSIGGLPNVGWCAIAGGILLLIALLLSDIAFRATLVIMYVDVFFVTTFLVWMIGSVFKYSTFFDWAFKQEKSQNSYAELVPEDGKYEYTVYLSGHTDTSWTLKHSAARTKLHQVGIFSKLGIGAVFSILICIAVYIAFALVMCIHYGEGETVSNATSAFYDYYFYSALYAMPFMILGAFLLTLYNEKNPRVASPGAMDNATGVAIAYEAVKYFKDNPDKLPKGCRVVDFNCGAEEAGLRGSINFVRKHKDDGMLENAWHINVDSIADRDYFEVIYGDAWLCPHFDKTLEGMLNEAMIDAGIKNPGRIVNPVGGCDSTPFQKAGVRSITIAAQNPTMTDYYHTLYDTPDRFDSETVGLGLDIVLRVIEKIGAFENNKK